MKTMIKRSLSIFLAVLMMMTCVSGFSITASAGEKTKRIDGVSYYYTIKNGNATITSAYTTKSKTAWKIPAKLDGKPVTKIGAMALYDGYDSVKTLSIPDSVVTLESRALDYLGGVTTINIGKKLKTITKDALINCPKLTKFVVSKDNKNLTAVKGNLYNKSKTKLIRYACGKTAKTFTVPKTVKSLGYGVFYYSKSLTKITLSSKITVIPNDAFGSCSKLATVTGMGKLTKIGTGAYANSAITSAKLPKTVTSIGYMAYYNCSKITSVDLSETKIKTIPKYCFSNSGVKSIKFPSTLTKISAWSIDGTKLTSVTVPKSVTKIGQGAFSYNRKLTQANLSNITLEYLPASIFENCSRLESVKYPKGMKNISSYSLMGTAITSFTFPKGIKKINSGCLAGTKISKITIPSTVTLIEYDALANCKNLKSVSIPNSVTKLSSSVFSGCTNLASVKLSTSMKAVYSDTFYNCKSLKSITLPSSVSLIGEYAFAKSGLNEITIKNANAEIYDDAFYGISDLTIKGRADSTAQTFAEMEGFGFVKI